MNREERLNKIADLQAELETEINSMRSMMERMGAEVPRDSDAILESAKGIRDLAISLVKSAKRYRKATKKQIATAQSIVRDNA
jgi:hypothetical protein